MEFERAAKAVDDAIKTHCENGAALVVKTDGKAVFAHCAGLCDIEGGRKFDENTICRAFSCTKIITSVCAMQLVERGRIDTSDELSWYIPEFSDP